MRVVNLDGPMPSFGQIYTQMMREVEQFGFLGDEHGEPVVLERRPQHHIMHALRHAHINDECVKNKAGVFCGLDR